MSETNITQQVASGVAPQPAAESAKPSDYNKLEKQASENLSSDSNDESIDAEAIDAAEQEGDLTPKEAISLKKKLKLKVDGQEIEEEVDLADEEYLKRELQKSKAFDKRAKEFAGYKSQVDQLLQLLQNDPEALLEKMGLNVDEFAEKRLTKKLEQLKKTPEQIEREKMQAELEELRNDKKRIQEEKEKADMERLRNEQSTQITNEIVEALDGAKSILPKKNPLVLQRIAQTMVLAMKNGYPNVTAKDVIPLVEKQWKQEMNSFFAESPEDLIEMLVGKEKLTAWRKSQYAKAKNKPPTPVNNKPLDTGATNKGPIETPVDLKQGRTNFKNLFKPV